MTAEFPNLRHLRAFWQVAENKGVSAAAGHVHMSQPAITQAIAKLEASLEARLFDRRPDGMFVTEVGDMFRRRVTRMFEHLEAGAREVSRAGARKSARGFGHFDQLLTAVQLRALVAVSHFGNFSLAARNVGISQPSLFRAARDVERLAGTTLFEKTSQGITLTRPAQALAREARLALAEYEQARMEIREWLGRDVGLIRVGTLPLARSFVLPTAINALTAESPGVRVSVVDGPYDDLLHGVRHGELDMLIGALRDPAPADDVTQEALFEAPLAIFSRPGHPLATDSAITADKLAACAWVVPREGTPTRAAFDALFEETGARPSNIVESSSLVLIRGLLTGSDRLTAIYAHQVLFEERMGILIRLPVAVPRTQRAIAITLRRGWRPTASQDRFLNLLRLAATEVSEELKRSVAPV